MARSTETVASVVNSALGFCVSLLRRSPTAVRYFSMFLVAACLFWKGAVQLLIHLAVPSLTPTNRQHLTVAAQEKTLEDAGRNTSTDSPQANCQYPAVQTGKQVQQDISPSAAPDSLPSLISTSSSTYTSAIGDLDLDPDDDFDELPHLDYIPPTPEDIKRWVELPFEERRKVHDMQYKGLNWLSWAPPSSPSLPPRRPLPEGILEWREEWSDFDLPPNPPHILTSEDLRRWWGEATEGDRARINRISTDGLNWRAWAPPSPQQPCDGGEPVVWSGIGPWAELDPNGSSAIDDSSEQMVDQQPLVQRLPHKERPL